jgi:hypothetical protein
MRYVVDSCVAVKWFLAEPDSTQAIQLLDDFNRQVHQLLAPDIFPVEIAHALSRAERRGLIQPPEGSHRRLRLPLRRIGRAGGMRLAHCRCPAREQLATGVFIHHVPGFAAVMWPQKLRY